jgi:hypothetical protein
MLKRLALAGALLCACVTPALAMERHHWRHHHHAHHADHRGVRAPAERPARWCGWYVGRVLGLYDRALWVARNWARVGAPTGPSPGAVVVWPHHVGIVRAVSGRHILVHSGNDGHRIRTRWRSMRGVIAFRRV